jgi:hypothetical protein
MKVAGAVNTLSSASQDREYDISSVVNLANKRLSRIEHIHNPLKIKVLNVASNNLASVNDIQLWYAHYD